MEIVKDRLLRLCFGSYFLKLFLLKTDAAFSIDTGLEPVGIAGSI